MVKSHAEHQKNPTELWFSILILGALVELGLAVLVESDGSAMAGPPWGLPYKSRLVWMGDGWP